MMRFLVCFLIAPGLLAAQPVNSDCALDGSVVNAATGEPLPRARVMLMGPNGPKGISTDNAGRWNFAGVSCGQTQVLAMKPGFLQGSVGQPRPGAAFRPVILSSGEAMHDVRIPLTPQAVVTGKVVDDQGDPMMGVQIVAMAARVVDGRRVFQGNIAASTNDLGEYRLAGLQPGKYIICAHANGAFNGLDPGDGTTVSGTRCYPGPPEGGAASAMDVHGSDTRADFTLTRVPAVKIRGTLAGGWRAGAGISLAKRGVSGAANRMQPGNVRPDGTFEISGVTPGSYLLTTDFWDAGRRMVARVPVDVASADIEGITVKLEPGFSMSGTVRLDSKKDPGGAPPTQTGLSLKSSDPLNGGGQLVWNKTRDAFSINELTSGNYRLEVFPNGPYYLKSAMLAGRDISREEVPITQAAGPIDVVLGDDGGSVEGQVEDADGKATAAWVLVLQAGRPPRTMMSRPDGHFVVANLAPGDYQVSAWDDWQQVEYTNPDWMTRHGAATGLTVAPGQSVTVRLKQQLVAVN